MNINDIMLSSCDLFRKGKFTECCELLQHTVDNCHLKEITTHDEVELIVLKNNLLICNCLVCILAYFNYGICKTLICFVKLENFTSN